MTEIREAAERLRIDNYGTADEEMSDLLIIKDEYLAEHPADDDEGNVRNLCRALGAPLKGSDYDTMQKLLDELREGRPRPVEEIIEEMKDDSTG